ncbi:MAG: hypothetical protein EOP33_07315 [Rickettsiaceae bacterium]|nr:MAG: hypothetical protein EOP33_07315 [Rickettsiaceae bacterium]
MRTNALYNAVLRGDKQEVIRLLNSGINDSDNPYKVLSIATSQSLHEITEELLQSSNFNNEYSPDTN